MTQSSSGQLIQPSSALRLRVGGRLGAIDASAIAKAEAALASLSANFGTWLQDEIDKLEAARQAVRVEGSTSNAMETLYTRAHDLKGLGATYGFPLVTRIGGLLCRLIEDRAKRTSVPMNLVDAHIDAIKAAVRDNIKGEDNPVGRMLVQELERQVREHGG